MEVLGAAASIVTLVALSKEISSIAKDLLHDYQQAPKALLQIHDQVTLVTLELECMNLLQQDNEQSPWLTVEETHILRQSLAVAKTSITTIKTECEKCIKAKMRLSTRLSWALFDGKTIDSALDQLQKTESRLLFVLQFLNTRRSQRVHVENTAQSALVLRELRKYHDEVTQNHPPSRSRRSTTDALKDIEQVTVFRHQYSLALTDYWKKYLCSGLSIDTFQNEYQTAYEFYVRLPILTLRGRMAFMFSVSFRQLTGYLPNITLLGGGLNFMNVVPVESEIVSACKSGDVLAVRKLFMEKKAAPNDMSVEDRTLLFYAARSGSTDLVRFLVNSGAPVQSRQLLASSYWRHPGSARLLLRHGANVEVLGFDGFTAASYLFGPSRPRVPQTEFIEILACNSFSQFNWKDKIGWTVLHRAAAYGTAADIRALISVGASTEMRTDRQAWTPICCAVCYGNIDTLQELLKYETDVHQVDFRGWNLLHIAAGYGNFSAVPLLIERGVDLHALSDATSKYVPPLLRGKCVSPGDVARNCGQEVYAKWVEAVEAAGQVEAVQCADIDWALEEVDGRFGKCECCDGWEA